MTLGELINEAAQVCLDERERHLVIFTEGFNGYVCKNEANTSESNALYKGLYRDCQVWIERRGIAAALRYMEDHMGEVPELSQRRLDPVELLRLIANLP